MYKLQPVLAVVFPMIAGTVSEISMCGNLAVLLASASREIAIPGKIEPPRYSHFSVMQSNVMAVPKSMTISLHL